MSSTDRMIDNLMKVSLDLQTDDTAAQKGAGTPFEFIFGIGPSGITPFEKALYRKRVGDRLRFDMAPGDHCQTVGHLEPALREQTGIMTPTCLQVTVTGVVRAKDREVIQAMAAGGSCSDCGCGCGGH